MNIEEIVEKIGVEKLAIAAANKNLPPTKSTKPDSNEDDIRQSFIDALFNEIKDINSKIDNFKIMIKEKIESSKNSIEVGTKAAKNFSHAASSLKTQKLTDLGKLKSELKTKKNDLEMFKSKHQLERSADYPNSMVYIYAIVAALLLVETLFNGFALSEKLRGGFAEGLGTAFFIAMVNVIPAFMVGKYIYIQIWHIQKFRRIACTLLSIAWFIFFSLGWNFYVAHTRSHMNIDTSLLDNITEYQSFFSEPPASMFDITGMQSWTLFFIGFIFSIIALIDGIKSDDKYFGYGEVDRQIKDIEIDITDIIMDLTKSLDKLKKDFDDNLSREEFNVNSGNSSIENYHASRDMLIRTFEDNVESVKGQAKIQIKKYREVNTEKREDDPPKFFEKEPAALVFKKRDFIKIDIDNLGIDPENTFTDAKLSIAKEYSQLNTEISEKIL